MIMAFSVVSVSLVASLLDAKFNSRYDTMSSEAEKEYNFMFAGECFIRAVFCARHVSCVCSLFTCPTLNVTS